MMAKLVESTSTCNCNIEEQINILILKLLSDNTKTISEDKIPDLHQLLQNRIPEKIKCEVDIRMDNNPISLKQQTKDQHLYHHPEFVLYESVWKLLLKHQYLHFEIFLCLENQCEKFNGISLDNE